MHGWCGRVVVSPGCRSRAEGLQSAVVGGCRYPLAVPGAAPQAAPGQVRGVVRSPEHPRCEVIEAPDPSADMPPGQLLPGCRVVGELLEAQRAAVSAASLGGIDDPPDVVGGQT